MVGIFAIFDKIWYFCHFFAILAIFGPFLCKMRPNLREPGSPTKSIDPKLGAPRKTAGTYVFTKDGFR
jgi:hypothetical protein